MSECSSMAQGGGEGENIEDSILPLLQHLFTLFLSSKNNFDDLPFNILQHLFTLFFLQITSMTCLCFYFNIWDNLSTSPFFASPLDFWQLWRLTFASILQIQNSYRHIFSLPISPSSSRLICPDLWCNHIWEMKAGHDLQNLGAIFLDLISSIPFLIWYMQKSLWKCQVMLNKSRSSVNSVHKFNARVCHVFLQIEVKEIFVCILYNILIRFFYKITTSKRFI